MVRFRHLLDAIAQDVRYAARTLRRAPAFTAAATITLALGIGATTAVFTLVNAVLLRPLPFADPDRLVEIVQVERSGNQELPIGQTFTFLRDHCTRCEQIAARKWSANGLNLVAGAYAEYVESAAVTSGYFAVFGARPLIGRGFTRDDEQRGSAHVAVLSHAAWQRVFHGSPTAIGQTVMLSGAPHTIVGVMPEAFRAMPPADIWTPLTIEPTDTDYVTIARLTPGVTLAQAQGEMETLTRGIREQFTGFGKDEAFRAMPLQSMVTSNARPVLLMLLAAVGLLLLIACANTAGLLIVRAAARRREIATRVAIGASRARIVGQLLTESLVLALIGGLLGLLAARWTIGALSAILPVEVTLWQDLSLDRRVLTMALIASAATGVLFGLLPALDATRIDMREALHESGGRASGTRAVTRLRHALVIGQVALSLLLLVGAGLLMRSVVNLLNVPTGIDLEHVMTAQMSMQRAAPDTFDYARFYADTLARIRTLPDVEAAAVVNDLPLTRGLRFGIRLLDVSDHTEALNVDWRYVTPEYFRVFRVPLLAGRVLGDAETSGSAPVALVNETFARRFLTAATADGQTPRDFATALGRHLAITSHAVSTMPGANVPRAIVGIVGDVRSQPSVPVRPTIYMPTTQIPSDLFRAAHRYFPANWVVRTRSGNAAMLTAALRDAVRAVDPQQPFSGFRTMAQVRERAVEEPRSQMLLLGAFAAIALVLAAAGIYGVIAYTVVQRTRELGIRLALGATPGGILSRILLHGVRLAVIGVGVGLAAAVAATRWLQPFVFGISPLDPATFAVTALFLIVIAAIASAVPAIRAARINPMTMVRSE
jgi:putative ABC transport system permease protein